MPRMADGAACACPALEWRPYFAVDYLPESLPVDSGRRLYRPKLCIFLQSNAQCAGTTRSWGAISAGNGRPSGASTWRSLASTGFSAFAHPIQACKGTYPCRVRRCSGKLTFAHPADC